MQELEGHKGEVRSILITPDDRYLISASFREIKIWDLQQNRDIHTLRGHLDVINTLAFDADRMLLASGGDDHTIQLWGIPGNF